MRRILPLLLLSAALSACSTVQGLKTDIARGYDAVTGTFTKTIDPVKEEKKRLPVYDGTCPDVAVREDLRSLTEFTDDANPSEKSRISEIRIVNVANVCRVEGDHLTMQIDLTLSGRTGPKGRMKPGDKPSFAYPYFVAVTDTEGNVLSKEIFAASLGYGKDSTEVAQTESIFQSMPYPDASLGRTFNVIVGFQLTPEQLAYNLSQAAAGATAQSASASERPAQGANE